MISNTVAHRVVFIILLISLFFALMCVGFFSMYERHRLTIDIEEEIENLREAQQSAIVEGLWNYDYRLILALLDGFCFHPYIGYAAILESNGKMLECGFKEKELPMQSYTLSRDRMDKDPEYLGVLYIQMDSSIVRTEVKGKIVILLIMLLLFMVLESIIILALFSKMVTKHLETIAGHIREFGAGQDTPPLNLGKRDYGDELDILVTAFNAMQHNLNTSRDAERMAMEQLKESEEVNRILIEEAPDAILILDLDENRFISCNRQSEVIFGRTREEILSSKPTDFFAPQQPDGMSSEDSFRACAIKAMHEEATICCRHILRPEGQLVICELRICLLPSKEHHIFRVSYRDITDQVRAEEAIARSLKEKDILLQEVYHRTKNNMQVIASLLNMQAMARNDDTITEVLQEMIGRISSMSLVHQKLYESKDLSHIDIGGYIEDLVVDIKLAYLDERHNVEIHVDAQSGIFFLLDAAIPCGLALNELIVNAIKYAFPGNRRGRICISVSREDAETVLFSVSDDGIGLPEGFDIIKDGRLGLQTVISLIEYQLQGTVSYSSGNGTSFSLRLREADDRKETPAE